VICAVRSSDLTAVLGGVRFPESDTTENGIFSSFSKRGTEQAKLKNQISNVLISIFRLVLKPKVPRETPPL